MGFVLYHMSVIVCNNIFTISLLNVSISNNQLSMKVPRSHVLEGSIKEPVKIDDKELTCQKLYPKHQTATF